MLNSEVYAMMTTPTRIDKSNPGGEKSPDTPVCDVFTNTEARRRGRPKKNLSSERPPRKSMSLDNIGKRSRAPSSSCIDCMKALEENKTIQCQMCDGFSCHKCSKIPAEMISFMTSGTCPWICRHCNRAGLPTLKNINDNVTKQSKQLKDLRETTDRQYQNLERKMEDLEKSIDMKINKKFESKKDEMKKEIEEKITTELTKQINEEMERIKEEQIQPDMAILEKSITDKIMEKIEGLMEEKMKKTKWPEQAEMEVKIEKLIEEKLMNSNNINTLDEALVKTIDSMIDKKIKENPIPSASGNVLVSPRTYMKTTVKNVASELKEKEKRMYNIIIFGLQVPAADNMEIRNKADKSNFIDFVNKNLEIDIKEDDVKDNFRLGKNDTNKSTSNSPPLMVVMRSLDMKERIFKSLYKLGRGKRDVTFNHDYTRLERDENKKLQEEAKDLTKNDPGSVYRVRGPPWDRKIVKLTTREEVITSQPIQMMLTDPPTQ